MLSKFIQIGDKIELREIGGVSETQSEGKHYESKVHDILSEDTLEIIMPMEKTKLILLSVDSEYDLVFVGKAGLYQCDARVIDRYKSSNMYILVVELVSNLRKYQRREYYRFSCSLEMSVRGLQEEEQKALESNTPYTLVSGIPMQRGVIVDISGGGLRFLSRQNYEPDSLLYINFYLMKGGVRKKYEIFGRALNVHKLENRAETWEYRVEYFGMNRAIREEIIKYIFEEERKNRRKERSM